MNTVDYINSYITFAEVQGKLTIGTDTKPS